MKRLVVYKQRRQQRADSFVHLPLPAELADELDRIAQKQGKTRTQQAWRALREAVTAAKSEDHEA